ncbi:hypothetical protein Trydic_g5693 [Trypoxylus dichotomus]
MSVPLNSLFLISLLFVCSVVSELTQTEKCKVPPSAPKNIEKVINKCQDEIRTAILTVLAVVFTVKPAPSERDCEPNICSKDFIPYCFLSPKKCNAVVYGGCNELAYKCRNPSHQQIDGTDVCEVAIKSVSPS